jgi:hypothetical protein
MFMIVYVCVMATISIAGLAYAIFWMMSAYKALGAISAKNRDMEPGMIFLMFIPCFNAVWWAFIVIRMASSMEKEFSSRGLKADGDFAKMLGFLVYIPCVGIICHIMWVLKIRGYTVQLAGGGKRSSKDDD